MFNPPALDSDSLEFSKELTKGRTRDLSFPIDLEFSGVFPLSNETPLST